MKKLFVSLPMRGREEYEIRAEMEELKQIVENETDDIFELIDSYNPGNPPSDVNDSCWYLGQSISEMAEADLVIFSANWRMGHGCIVEHMICGLYDIPYVELKMPDIVDLENAEVIVDYTHDLDEQPVEIVDKIDISHDDVDDYDPDLDELEPGEYNADLA